MRDKVLSTLKRINKTRTWLADSANIAKQNMSSWLNGKDTLSQESIDRIKYALKEYDESFGYKNYHLEWSGKRYDFDNIDEIVSWVKDLDCTDFVNSITPIYNDRNEQTLSLDIIIAPVDNSIKYVLRFPEIIR